MFSWQAFPSPAPPSLLTRPSRFPRAQNPLSLPFQTPATQAISDPKTTKMPGGYFQKNWVGMRGTLPETLTLFQTKIFDFPYPISDLIKNLIPYFRPEALEPGA